MHTQTHTPTGAKTLHRCRCAISAIALATLLGGCSIWPKALTFGADPEPVPQPSAGVVNCADCLGSATPTPAIAAQSVAVAAPIVAQTPVASSALPDSAKTEALPSAKAKPDAVAPERPSVPNAPTKSGALVPGFYINVGLFSVPTNGTRAYKKLEDAGLPVFSDGIKTKQGSLTRVRVGPFNAREEADAAAKQIRSLKLDAVVFKH